MRPFYRRTFLNRRGHHAGAYAIAEVRLTRGTTQQAALIDACLTIADCHRVAMLDFHASERRDVANAVHKARVLRVVVVDFVAALEHAAEEWEATTDR